MISLALLAACSPAASGASAGASAGASGGGTPVAVTLQEFSVLPDPDSVPAGSVTFTVTNDGPDDVHEFVIIQTDLDPGDLPVDDTGAVDESGDGIEVIDEIEDIPVGETVEITVDLAAGAYVLVCNIYDADEDEAHYAMGMRAAFTVEGG
jgi:iron uptake system component EfeO